MGIRSFSIEVWEGVFLALLFCTGLFAIQGATAAPDIEPIYPQGKRFPLALYDIRTAADMKTVRPFGWNAAHSYTFSPAFFKECEEAGFVCMPLLPGKDGKLDQPLPEEEIRKLIEEMATHQNIAWWNLPEERRYWYPDEMAIVTRYSAWTRQYDPLRRPNYMYIPGNYLPTDVMHYVPYLDIVPASVYTTYAMKPHAWVRWRMESTIQGIKLAGAAIGPDYLRGEKTPVAVLELFYETTDPKNPARIMTPQGAYHDFWQCIASGAKGIYVFSYRHKADKPSFEENWKMYCKAASELTGKERLDEVVLYGEEIADVQVTVLEGPSHTEPFLPDSCKDEVTLPSIHVLCKKWRGKTYLVAVNSAEAPVHARLSHLPTTARQASILFQNRTVPITDGSLTLEFEPLGVHILKM
jgi:hypothetical protein